MEDFNFSHYSQQSQLQTSSEIENTNVKIIFIIPLNKTKRDLSEKMSHAFQLTIDHSLVYTSMDEKDVVASTPKDGNVFVLESFEGAAFDILNDFLTKNRTIKILGPQCLRYVMQRAELNCAIKNLFTPTLTLGMMNASITLSGFQKDERLRIFDLIQSMNGHTQREFTITTTHVVVAHDIYTAKVLAAFKKDVPVMRKEWVYEVFEKSQVKVVVGSDPEFLDFICPIFFNLTIAISQVHNSLKLTLKNLIERNGGTCSFQLKKGETNILIIPKPEGDKFKYANDWKVPCVNPEWIQKCVEEKRLLSYDKYRVKATKPKVLSSTHLDSTLEREVEVEIDNSNFSLMSNVTNLNTSARTINTTDIDGLRIVLETPNSTARSEANLEVLRVAALNGSFLDGCRIYLSGAKSEEMKKVINDSGAMRLEKINSQVTHIIVMTDSIPSLEIPIIKALEQKPHIVRFDWILASAQNGYPADEEFYEISLNAESGPSEPKKSIQPVPFQSFPDSNEMELQAKSQSILIELENEPEQEPVEVIGTRASRESLRKGSSEQTRKGRSTHGGSINRPDSNIIEVPLTDSSSKWEDIDNMEGIEPAAEESQLTSSETSYPCIFLGLKFKILDELKEHRELLEIPIKKLGGEIDRLHPDIVIGPPIRREIVDPGINCVTEYWLNECHVEGKRDIEGKFHHISLESNPKSKGILKGVVAAVSAYTTDEKDYIAHLIIGLGGQYQEVFARKASVEKGNVLKSTHLICSTTENAKYKAANRWSVPVVTVDWVIACCNEKTRVNELKYLTVDKQGTPDSTINFFPITPRASRYTSALGRPPVPIVPKGPTPKNSFVVENEILPGGFKTPPIPQRVAVLSNRTRTPSTPDSPLTPESQSPLTQTPESKSPTKTPKFRNLIDMNFDDTGDSPFFNPCGIKWPPDQSEDSLILEEMAKRHAKAHERMAREEKITDIPRWIRRSNPSDDECASPATKKLRRMLGKEHPSFTQDISTTTEPNESLNGHCLHSNLDNQEKENEPRVATPRDSPVPCSSKDVHEISPRKSNNEQKQNAADDFGSIDFNEMDEEFVPDKQFKEGDVVIFISTTCQEVVDELKSTITRLGGFITADIKDPFLTHVIFQGKSSLITNYSKQVENKDKVHFCKPGYIWECSDANAFIPFEKSNATKSRTTDRTTRSTRSRSKGQLSEQPKLSIAKSTINDVMNDEIPSTQDLIGKPKIIWDPNDAQFSPGNICVEVHKSPPKESQPLTFTLNNSNPKRTEIIEGLKKLGGIVNESQVFDQRVDGLVTNNLTRNEKALCSIASGAFIVKDSYVFDSLKSNKFLDNVDDYFFKPEDFTKTNEKSLARSALYWFKKIKNGENHKPYYGMSIYLIEKEQRKNSIVRLIIAGGGKTVESPEDATIVLSSDENKGSKLANEHNIPYNPVNLLNEMLTEIGDNI